MSSEQVWYRFQGKKKNGSVIKLRIQDLPPIKLNDAIDLLVNVHMRDEPLHKAAGIVNNPKAVEWRRNIYMNRLSDPSYFTVICCSDHTPDVTNLMGLSTIGLVTDKAMVETVLFSSSMGTKTQELSKAARKFVEIDYAYFDGKSMVVDPAYRGLGIAENFLKVRRLMCKAHRVPMAAAWMTAIGTQIAAARAGWETVKEVEYDYLAKKYDVTFTDVPRTIKLMLDRVDNTVI